MLDDHKGWVNGVCWDPLNQFIATISSDRILRVYNTKNYKNLCKTYKAQLPIDAVCPQTQNANNRELKTTTDLEKSNVEKTNNDENKTPNNKEVQKAE